MALPISRGGTGPYWTISRGTAFDSGVLALKDASGAALDLTDCTLRLLIGRTVRTIPTIEVLVGTGIVVVDAEAGLVAVRLSTIQTASFASGTFVYELTVAQGDELILQLNGGGTASRTLTGNLGEGAVPPTPDAFAGLVEGRPLLTDAISETEDFVVSDPARGPNRLGRRRAKPILDAKADQTTTAAALATKADAAATAAALALKADQSTVAAGLATKADAAATTTALATKAPLASAALTGTPTAPTPPTADNSTRIATMAAVQAVVAALVNSSPAALDTLNELAAALGNDPNFAATMLTNLAAKQNATFAPGWAGIGSAARTVAEKATDWLSAADYGGTNGTVSNLLAARGGTKDGQVALVSGRSAPQDGGGGLFVWEASSTVTADGAIVVQASGVSTGRWRRIVSRGLNVRWFGARGDGLVKANASISAGDRTLNAVSSIPFTPADVGKTVIIPGAGVGGADLNTTIAQVNDDNNVEISVDASVSVLNVSIVYGTNDAPAFKDAFEYAISQSSSKRAHVSHNSASAAGNSVQVNGPEVWAPAGTYVWGDATGWLRTGTGKTLVFRGEGMSATRIEMCGVNDYFIQTGDFVFGHFSDMTLIGGKGFYKSNTTGPSVGRGMYFAHIGVHRYTECAFGNTASDFPRWHIEDCDIQQFPNGNAIGIALSGNNNECVINGNSIIAKYGLKIDRGGNTLRVCGANFITRPVAGGAAIWIVPYSNIVNSGQGLTIDELKLAGELSVPGAKDILIADEGAGTDFCNRQHATTLSSGWWAGASLSNILQMGNTSGASPPLIYSYTPNISGLRVNGLYITGSLPQYVIEYDPVVPELPGRAEVKNNIIEGVNVDQLDNNVVQTFQVSNLPGAANVIDPLGVFSDSVCHRSFYGAGRPSDYKFIAACLGNGLAAGGNSVVDFLDDEGVIGGEWTFVGGSPGNLTLVLSTNLVNGRQGWVDVDLGSAASQSLPEAIVQIRQKDSSFILQFGRPVKLAASGLLRYTAPFIVPNKGADVVRLHIMVKGYVAGVTNKLRVGRVHVYHGAHPVPHGHVQTYGANAGLLTGQHFMLGTTHIAKGAAAPTTGTWAVGDTVFNSAVSAGGSMGWVCTTAGTPGTWKTWGPVSA